ncbi:hypothetical protein K438DRAFT_2116670 [Mycena galopus ATCC 62051]|nr:hypothetical protein K438DRAFT_2116670 [Mycena galopus ATCC 62051]
MEFVPPPPKEVIEVPDGSDDEGVRPPKQALPGASTAENNIFSDFESDGDEDDENEVDMKPLIAPSTDITADFENALQDGFDFDGVFAFSQRYTISSAPNPCLNIDGLGTVGIPLSQRDARAIISGSVPVCGTNTDTKTPGMWEFPSEKVHFENPAWNVWIQTAAGVAASTALTAYTTVNPSFILKKLVIHEKSSQPISEDEADRKIGDFVVVLPGNFEGAQLQLRHAGQVKTLNFAHQSGLSTSVVAAYTGVEHTLAAVSSGYRLSLVYDIVQPITHVGERPILPEMQGATQKLQNVLRSWKQKAPEEAPELLACLLQHTYSKSPNFSAKSLTGADALLISHLYPLARELKFRVYLAHVKVTVSTPSEAEDPGYGGGYGGCGYGGYGGYGRGRYGRGYGRYGGYYDYEDEEDEDMEIDDEDFVDNDGAREEHLVLSRIVDLRGMPVDVDLNLEASDLLNGSITDQDPDTESLERDDRTVSPRSPT